MNVVEVKNITKIYNLYKNDKDILKDFMLGGNRYEEFTALKNISFNIKKGETYGILGGNGSGKSTVLNIINGTSYPTKGKVITKGKVSLLNVGAGIINGYTGVDNIYYKCGLIGLSKKEIDDRFESIKEFSELGEFLDQKVSKYSSGMRSKLGFAIAIHVEPDILIIDEALAVGDSRFAKKCHEKMNELKEKGVTIIYVSHNSNTIRSFCTRVCWINQGVLIGEGDPMKISKVYENYMNGKVTLEQSTKNLEYLKYLEKLNSDGTEETIEIYNQFIDGTIDVVEAVELLKKGNLDEILKISK